MVLKQPKMWKQITAKTPKQLFLISEDKCPMQLPIARSIWFKPCIQF
jgi:hypothetical protein